MADFLSDMFGGGAEREAADKDRAAAALYQNQALPTLATGYDTATAATGKGIAAYDPLATLGQKYGGATDTYLGALGVNGPDAAKAAQAQFTTSPGYQAGIDAGLTGINRARSLAGGLSSGTTDVDALTYAQNNQNQQYNTWLQNLASAGQTGVGATTNAAGGQASGYTNLASLGMTNASNIANVYGNVESTDVAANNLQGAGEAAGAKNLLNAGMQVAKGATAMFAPIPG